MFERHFAREVGGHHDHPGDPEEDDVVACYQHAAGQVEVVVAQAVGVCPALGRGGNGLAHTRFAHQIAASVPASSHSCIVGPSHGTEGDQGGGVPGVEHVLVALEFFAGGLGLCLGLVACDIDLAVFVVPGRNLMAPPKLTADAPVLDVVHPLVVGVDPVFGHKLYLAGLHGVDGFLRDGFAGGVDRADFGRCHKPLVGEHGFDDLTGARAARHHEFVFFDFDQQA